MYIVFIGLVAVPIVQIASIGTQFTEAFAGLDRIHEIRSVATERTRRDARGFDESAATSRSRTSASSTTMGSPCCATSRSGAAAGSTTALVGSTDPARAR